MFKALIRRDLVTKITANLKMKGASRPAELVLSERKMKDICPNLKDSKTYQELNKKYMELGGFWLIYAQFLYAGDCNPAIVAQLDPLLVSCYAEDIDCVVMLKFEQNIAKKYKLTVGQRLLGVNNYGRWKQPQPDILLPSDDIKYFNAYRAMIADFLSDDTQMIKQRKNSIPEYMWKRCEELSKDYLMQMPLTYRMGNLQLCINPIMLRGVKLNPLENIG